MQRDEVTSAMLRASRWEALSREDRAAVAEALRHARVARNADSEFLASRTFGERLADRIAAFGGSWTFILLFFGVLIAWTFLNTVVLARRARAFDPYPYVFLNLMLSMLAALQAPVIMMSQRRQTVRDRVEAQTDYEVNLKAELEIRALHEKLDTLREAQWAALVRMQQEQIGLLQRLLGTPPGGPSPARSDATERP
jgi:uncharacterized membrane protein